MSILTIPKGSGFRVIAQCDLCDFQHEEYVEQKSAMDMAWKKILHKVNNIELEHSNLHKVARTDQPSVGRVVHYYDKRGEGPFAAIVIGVNGDKVDLTVFKLTGQFVIEGVHHRHTGPGTWTWPTRHGAS